MGLKHMSYSWSIILAARSTGELAATIPTVDQYCRHARAHDNRSLRFQIF